MRVALGPKALPSCCAYTLFNVTSCVRGRERVYVSTLHGPLLLCLCAAGQCACAKRSGLNVHCSCRGESVFKPCALYLHCVVDKLTEEGWMRGCDMPAALSLVSFVSVSLSRLFLTHLPFCLHRLSSSFALFLDGIVLVLALADTARLPCLPLPQPSPSFLHSVFSPTNSVTCMSFSDDCSMLAAGADDSLVRVVSLTERDLKSVFAGQKLEKMNIAGKVSNTHSSPRGFNLYPVFCCGCLLQIYLLVEHHSSLS